MDLQNLPGDDPLRIESKALENRLRRLRDTAVETGGMYSEKHLRRVSKDLESIFVKQLLDTMHKSVPQSSLYGTSSGMETWKGMFNEKLAVAVSGQESIGLAEMIYNQLSADLDRHREVPPAEDRSGEKGTAPVRQQIKPLKNTGTLEKSSETNLPGPIARFRALIEEAAGRHRLDPALIAAVMIQESGGDPKAVSTAGARGLMQLMPETWESLGVADPYDPPQNIEGGSRYLKTLLESFSGDETLALAAYNAGPSAVKRYGKIPPYPETQNFVRSVMALKKRFAELSPQPRSEG
jgi:soluble lytic murein transglycosylase-like protein